MSICKIKKDEQLNDRQLNMSRIAHQIAEQSFIYVWNEAVKHFSKVSSTTGDELISHLSTLTADFTARFIFQLKVIVDDDETGYSIEELQQGIFDGVSAMLQIKKPIRNSPSSINSEIKRIY